MTTDQFRQALNAQPFRPFVIRTADGREYPVEHPETALLSRGGRTVAVHAGGDAFAIIDLLLIPALDFEPAAPKRGKRR
jgi:hypothetical protein